jgi:hypothetical protein
LVCTVYYTLLVWEEISVCVAIQSQHFAWREKATRVPPDRGPVRYLGLALIIAPKCSVVTVRDKFNV